jgi:hypothetical protein
MQEGRAAFSDEAMARRAIEVYRDAVAIAKRGIHGGEVEKVA